MKRIRLLGLTALLGLLLSIVLTACNVEAEKILTGISLNTDNVRKEFTVGDEFTHDGLIVTANYSDESSESVTDYTVSEPDMSVAGEKTVTVTYQEKTADYIINVSAAYNPAHVLESITINTDNVQKTFVVGDTFNYNGLVVTAHFETAPLSEVISAGYTVSTPDMSTEGVKTVTVTYQGKTAEYVITVEHRALQSISLNITAVKRTFTVGEDFTCEGLIVTAHYNFAPLAETITDYVVNEDELDMSVVGQRTVVVTYLGKTARYEIIIVAE